MTSYCLKSSKNLTLTFVNSAYQFKERNKFQCIEHKYSISFLPIFTHHLQSQIFTLTKSLSCPPMNQPCTTVQWMQYRARPCSTVRVTCSAVRLPCKFSQYHALPCSSMQVPKKIFIVARSSLNSSFHMFSATISIIYIVEHSKYTQI
jgi:hypothetical protein